MSKLSHIDNNGKAKMVDISNKNTNVRKASASCVVRMSSICFNAIKENTVKKGDVLTVAKIAGIQAGKKTSDIIPLCHNILIDSIDIEFITNDEGNSIQIITNAVTDSKTGIEMEAITATTVSAITIYDMCKAIDKSIVIDDIKLIMKTGGKSGDYYRGMD